MAGLNQSIEALDSKKQSLENDIESLTSSLEQVRSGQTEAVLDEIQSNIAFKLGLRAVASQQVDLHNPELLVTEGYPSDFAETDSSFEDVFAENLKKRGVTSVIGDLSGERKKPLSA